MAPFLPAPGWRRSLILRRIFAGLLLAIAGGLWVVERTSSDTSVVVFIRPVEAGRALSADDLALVEVPDRLVPPRAIRDPSEVEGYIVVAAAEPGEVATAHRFVESAGIDPTVTNSTHLVPMRLAEPEIAALLHHGDTVNVITRRENPEKNSGSVEVIAAGGIVILSASPHNDGTILLRLPSEEAQKVAAASLSAPLTVVVTGERAFSAHLD